MDENNKKRVADISHEIVSELAPNELVLFEDFKEQFFKNPEGLPSKASKKKEKTLGFALPGGAEQFVTLLVLPVIYKVIDKYRTEKKTAGKLDAEKLKTLREEAYNTAIASGIKKEKAELIADSFIGKLAQRDL